LQAGNEKKLFRGALERRCPTPSRKVDTKNTMNTAQAIERMCQVIRRQHKALSTEDTYIFWLRRYMQVLTIDTRARPPELAEAFGEARSGPRGS
jgi:hypothetical protein